MVANYELIAVDQLRVGDHVPGKGTVTSVEALPYGGDASNNWSVMQSRVEFRDRYGHEYSAEFPVSHTFFMVDNRKCEEDKCL